MTFKQMNNLAGITKEEWDGYVRGGLIENKNNCAEGCSCTDDVKKVSLIRLLLKIGFGKSEIKKYFSLLEKAETDGAVKLLRNAREKLLSCIHEKQKYLDILDCIIRETKEIKK